MLDIRVSPKESSNLTFQIFIYLPMLQIKELKKLVIFQKTFQIKIHLYYFSQAFFLTKMIKKKIN